MGQNSKIQWCHHTFNPWIGCQKVSAECEHCYAEGETFVRIQRSRGRELWGNRLRSERHVTSDANWRKPIAWNRAAEQVGERHRVFCASLADVFEARDNLDEPRARLFALIEATPALDWLLLTKRPENVMEMVPSSWRTGFPPQVWLGTSCGTQAAADERIPHLLRTPAAVRFLSCEPLLGPVDLTRPAPGEVDAAFAAGFGASYAPSLLDGIHWVIIGGES